jgi:hypothetical protein
MLYTVPSVMAFTLMGRADGEDDGETDTEGEAEGEREMLGDADGKREMEGDADGEREVEGVGVGVWAETLPAHSSSRPAAAAAAGAKSRMLTTGVGADEADEDTLEAASCGGFYSHGPKAVALLRVLRC